MAVMTTVAQKQLPLATNNQGQRGTHAGTAVLWGEIGNKHAGLEPVSVGAHAINPRTSEAEAKHISVSSRPACL